jgi:hypothetical protein
MKINMQNLKIARDGLLGLDPDAFDMETYRKYQQNGSSATFHSLDDCGTVGCALGWCPFIPGLKAIERDYNMAYRPYIQFYKYSERVFGIEENSPIWNYLFSGNWKHKDNTVEGLIKRMTKVIEGKVKTYNRVLR